MVKNDAKTFKKGLKTRFLPVLKTFLNKKGVFRLKKVFVNEFQAYISPAIRLI